MLLGNDSEDYPVVVEPADYLQAEEHLFSLDGGREDKHAGILGNFGDAVAVNTVVLVGLAHSQVDPL